MPTQLENITTKLQSALDKANALPEAIELDELSNPGSAATMLEGTEMLDAEGKKVTGTIETKTEDDLTINGRYVVVPVGYYAEEASKTINDATIPDPVITVDANGKITATTITGKAGFVASEMEYTSTKQLSTQASKTITPTKSSQTAVESGKYTTGAVSVGPIPDEYADVSGVTAKTEDVIVGTTFVDATGAEQTGKLNTSTIKVLNSERTSAFEIPVDSRLNIVDQTYLIAQPAEELFGTTNTSKVLSGETFTSFNGRAQVGTMPNNGDTSTTIDGLETQSVTVPAGYTSGGTVALDSTINDTVDSQAAQIAEIAALLEGKSVPGGGTGVETCTVTVSAALNSPTTVKYYYMKNGTLVTEDISTDGIAGFDRTFEADKNTVLNIANISLESGGYPYQTVTGGTFIIGNALSSITVLLEADEVSILV